MYHSPEEPGSVQLRTEYNLDDVIKGIDDEFQQVTALAVWTNSRWSHSGSNKPLSRNPRVIIEEAGDGTSFRYVEYSLVMAAAVQALGMPARMLGWGSKPGMQPQHVQVQVT